MRQEPVIFAAIDTNDLEHAKDLMFAIAPVTSGIKLGLEFFNAFGPQGVEIMLAEKPDAQLFLDLKFHDIPNTVAGAVKAITSRLKPAYINVHAAGGEDMMKAAKAACPSTTKMLAVTVLTSLDDTALSAVGQGSSSAQVKKLAKLAQECGLDGVVCSAHEIDMLRKECGPGFILMVPGIRPEGSSADDQKRIMTPKLALEKGASHLVIGRPITAAPDPAQAAKDILSSL